MALDDGLAELGRVEHVLGRLVGGRDRRDGLERELGHLPHLLLDGHVGEERLDAGIEAGLGRGGEGPEEQEREGESA